MDYIATLLPYETLLFVQSGTGQRSLYPRLDLSAAIAIRVVTSVSISELPPRRIAAATCRKVVRSFEPGIVETDKGKLPA